MPFSPSILRLLPDPSVYNDTLASMDAYLDLETTRTELREAETARRLPTRVLSGLRERGLGLLLAEADGEPSLVTMPHLAVLNALTARRSGSLAISVGINALALLPVWIAGSDAQRERVFHRVREGAGAALLLSEWERGSDLLRNETRAERGVSEGDGFRAVGTDERPTHYRLSGEKHLINGASWADFLVTLARTQPRPETKSPFGATLGLSVFLCERDPSVRVLPRYETLPAPAAEIGGIRFDGTVVGHDRLLGKEGEGFGLVQKTLTISRGGVGALAAGASSAALALTVAHARSRSLYGQPITALDGLVEHVLRCAALELVANATALKSAYLVNACGFGAAHATAVTKYVCGELAEEAVREGAKVLSSRALVVGPYERLWGDVQLYPVFDGTRHVMLEHIATALPRLAERDGDDAPAALEALQTVYRTPPRSLVTVTREAPKRVPTLLATVRALASAEASFDLAMVASLVHAFVRWIAEASRSDRFRADQEVRFRTAETYALLEALVATLELVENDCRRRLGLRAVDDDAGGPTAALLRYAVGGLGSRICVELRSLATRCRHRADVTREEELFLRLADDARDTLRSTLRT